MLSTHAASCSTYINTAGITLPDNFAIEVYAKDVPGVRAMTFAPDGTLFAGSLAGKVYAVTKDRNVFIIDEGLRKPIGIDFHENNLYVSDISKILKYRNILQNVDDPPLPVVLIDGLPDERHHGGKFIKVGPDNKIYINIGAPCNVCLTEDDRYATISRADLKGEGLEVFSRGVRNSVGFDWHPDTAELWFTDNGRDWLGDNSPPDELNRARAEGEHFGFPYIHGKTTIDPKFGKLKVSRSSVPPLLELPAHVAPLGMRFYTGRMFPDYYRNGIFIAEHGSWNRSEKIGCRITFVKLREDRVLSYEVFASGWLRKERYWGRPADVEVGPDGALYVSDDKADVIYRIYYMKK